MRSRDRQAGFTMVELMIVVVILGILAAVAAPSMSRDRTVRDGRDFARDVANQLQRARMLAVSDHLRARVYFFVDRVEVRQHTQATPTSAPVIPDAATPPVLRVQAKSRIAVFNALLTGTPAVPGATPTLSATTPVIIDFDTMGKVVGDKTIYVYLRNQGAPTNSLERDFRIDIQALSGQVMVRPRW